MSLIRNTFKRLHYPVDVIAQCVRWYLAYSLSLRDLEEIRHIFKPISYLEIQLLSGVSGGYINFF